MDRVKPLCFLLGFLLACALGFEVHAAGQRYSALLDSVYTETLTLPPDALVTPAWTTEERDCLARTVYGEARGQRFEGQVAVAAVAVNRALSGEWPADLCGVVKQRAQFAGYWAKNEFPRDSESSYKAVDIATEQYWTLSKSFREVIYFTSKHEYSKFHAGLQLKGVIEDHAFYTDRKAK